MAISSDPSAWMNFRRIRVATRPIGRPRKNEKRNMFYGYPAELIAEWCSVAVSTAYAYKTGHLKPSKPAAKLFRLHRDRMVLTREWRGWFVTQNAIVDPDGNETPRGLLHNYYLMLQYCRELAVRTGDEQEIARWRRLLEAA
jgi:hypothetical protein